jgi:hypothetical protein
LRPDTVPSSLKGQSTTKSRHLDIDLSEIDIAAGEINLAVRRKSDTCFPVMVRTRDFLPSNPDNR